jgi:hypothetical protein
VASVPVAGAIGIIKSSAGLLSFEAAAKFDQDCDVYDESGDWSIATDEGTLLLQRPLLPPI